MKVAMVLDHGVAARYWMDVALSLNRRHALYCAQSEDDFADFWFNQYNLPFNNLNADEEFDVYLTSGTEKLNTKYSPRRISAKRKIFLAEPPALDSLDNSFDTVLVASEFARRKLLGAFSGKIRVTGYPPFERAVNLKLQPSPALLIATDWLYEEQGTKDIIKIGKDYARLKDYDPIVKMHPYQRWRQAEKLAEIGLLMEEGLDWINGDVEDPLKFVAKSSAVICIRSVLGMESTLAKVPTYFLEDVDFPNRWGFHLKTRDFSQTDTNRMILMKHFKTDNVLHDILEEIES